MRGWKLFVPQLWREKFIKIFVKKHNLKRVKRKKKLFPLLKFSKCKKLFVKIIFPQVRVTPERERERDFLFFIVHHRQNTCPIQNTQKDKKKMEYFSLQVFFPKKTSVKCLINVFVRNSCFLCFVFHCNKKKDALSHFVNS